MSSGVITESLVNRRSIASFAASSDQSKVLPLKGRLVGDCVNIQRLPSLPLPVRHVRENLLRLQLPCVDLETLLKMCQ